MYAVARALLAVLLCVPGFAQQKAPDAGTFRGLKFREVGPALTSGRVVDFAVDPTNPARYFVATASGGLWLTENGGATYKPVFDGESSYSIGCVTLDPKSPDVVWVGTGENNSQRSVAYGDGVYRSSDGGRHWKLMGLAASEHVAKILIHPKDSRTLYVAAQGPLWRSGGDRGLYKTTDGGTTWTRVLYVSEDTGVTDVVMDPRDPEVLYAAAYQRRRHVWTLIDGGPEAGIHKSIDGGRTWRQIKRGLPQGDLGRIGLAIAPSAPDRLYAIVEAAKGEGFYRSSDQGESWTKVNDYVSGSPQYYQELVVDPVDADRVYSMDVLMKVSSDGGRTWDNVGETNKHVDNHALWIDPERTSHLLAGCDGGIYESFDRGRSWIYKPNLPITQFYKVCADNAWPFYNVYGGTQDNFSLGGPSRTTSAHGILNSDWFVTQGGDGFETAVDPLDHNVIYAQAQHGVLVRFDRRSGDSIDIQPQVAADHEPLRWNWSSPLIISPHASKRLYFAANYVFRSDDRGQSWNEISGNLTRQLDRDALPVMGRVWEVDAVAKNRSTSVYGNVVALAESPLREGWLWVGTDDGLVQSTQDGGKSWTRVGSFPGVPDQSYVSGICPSRHDPLTVYATFDNHKRGDFKPYVLRSRDGGSTWDHAGGDLPERGQVHCLVEDHVEKDLLFVGTEFGVHFTTDGGAHWLALKNGLPTIACRDLDIQRREDDLVVGTFGRGIFILDDYGPLRAAASLKKSNAVLFPVKRAWMYPVQRPLGGGGKSFQGESLFTADNPPYGAIFTYYIREGSKTLLEKRHEAEARARKKGEASPYPTWDALREEEREEKPLVVLTVRDTRGEIVRRLEGSAGAGVHRVAWDLRYPSPVVGSSGGRGRGGRGVRVAPGVFSVGVELVRGGEVRPLGQPQTFEVDVLPGATFPVFKPADVLTFHQQIARLTGAVDGAARTLEEAKQRIAALKGALAMAPGQPPELGMRLRALELKALDMETVLLGDRTRSSREQAVHSGLRSQVGRLAQGASSFAEPTSTHRSLYERAAGSFSTFLEGLGDFVERELPGLEKQLDAAGVPWTPGRFPRWSDR